VLDLASGGELVQEPLRPLARDASSARVEFVGPLPFAEAPVETLAGALFRPDAGRPVGCLDGKVADLTVRSGSAVVADWDFADGVETSEVRDRSGNGLHGRLVNSPARAVTGPSWRGRGDDLRERPAEYNAVHFHD